MLTKSSTENVEASKPPAKLETVNIDNPLINLEPSGSIQDKTKDGHLVTMLTKKGFRDNKHLRSGRYYLPQQPNLSSEGRKSRLLTNLVLMSAIYPCGAIYRRCHAVVPMLRLGSIEINDLLHTRIQYWDISFLFVKNGYTVGVKCPTENDIEWLSTPSEDVKTILENALADENNSCGIPSWYQTQKVWQVSVLLQQSGMKS